MPPPNREAIVTFAETVRRPDTPEVGMINIVTTPDAPSGSRPRPSIIRQPSARATQTWGHTEVAAKKKVNKNIH